MAALIDCGTPPERILLLTFSRRAATELLRRAEALAGHDVARRVWGGTFHSVGNRVLRRHGRALGLDPDFTVLDQADAADLLALVRSELHAHDGIESGDRRRAKKDTMAAILSRVINTVDPAFEGAARDLPVVRRGARRAEGDVRGVHRPQAIDGRPRLRRPLAVLVGARALPRRRALARAVRSRLDRRVPGHQRAAGRDRRRHGRRGRHDHRSRRRRPGDLRLPQRDPAQHPRVPRAVRRTAGRARPQPPIDPGDPRHHQRRDRRSHPASREGALVVSRRRSRARARHLLRRRRAVCGGVRAHPRAARARRGPAEPGRVVPRRPPQRPARARARRPPHPVREVRRAALPRGGARERPRVRAAARDQPTRRARVVSRAAAHRRHRACHRPQARAPRRRVRRARGGRR